LSDAVENQLAARKRYADTQRSSFGEN